MDTQRRDRDQQQRIARRLLRAFEQAPVFLIGLDADGIVRFFSGQAEQITGYRREDMLGARFVDVLVPEELHVPQGAHIEDLAAGRREPEGTLEGAIRPRSGELRHVRWVPLHEPPEQPGDVALFLIGRDTTDLRAEESRARRIEKLAAAGSLVAGLAHELRNPLNGAHLHATLLERTLKRAGCGGEEAASALEVVQREMRRLSQLVSDFLDFARPQPLDLREVSLRAVGDRALARVTPLAERSGVKLEAELPPAEEVVELDPDKVDLGLQNLLRNAVEAVASAGGGEVRLRAARRPGQRSPDRCVVFEVEHDGPGLLDPEAPIFDPFYSTKESGTGLGLAIVQRVASDHDGVVELDSRPGLTVFRMCLPEGLLGAHVRGRRARERSR